MMLVFIWKDSIPFVFPQDHLGICDVSDTWHSTGALYLACWVADKFQFTVLGVDPGFFRNNSPGGQWGFFLSY